MKIEKITIENINSIEKAEISLSEGVLANEPLFLITGETGSGKSTILDAITLALYDKSPRYENTKNKEKTENGLTNMQSTTNALRKGTNDGKAEVWFSIGSERYIATWQMHKTRNGKYDMTNRRKLEIVKGEERIVLETKIDIVNQKVVELVGLTYDQFVRSVMLAQGHFNTFLTSEKSKQTEILEMLTGTEVYSKIAEIVGRRKNDAKNEVDKANDIYNSLNKNILTDEKLAELNDELAQNQDKLEKNETEIKKLEQDLRNIGNLEKLHAEIEDSKSQLADLQESYTQMLEEKETLAKSFADLKKQIDEDSVKKPMFEQMQLIINLLQEIESSEKTIAECNNDIEKFQNQITLKENESANLSVKLSEAAEAQKKATSDYEKCNDDFTKANLNQLIADHEAHKKELANQENRKTTCIRVKQILNDYNFKKQIIEAKQKELSELKYNLNICESEFSAKKSDFQTKDGEYLKQKNMVDDYIKSLRAKLKEGEPCPLCGSTSHAYHDEAVVNNLFKTIEKAWEEARNAFEAAKDTRNKAENNVKMALQSIDNEQKQLKMLDDSLIKMCNDKPIYDVAILDKGLVSLDEKIKAEEVVMQAINEKIKQAQIIQKRLQMLLQTKTKADEEYKTIDNKCIKLKNEIADIDGRIKIKNEIAQQTDKIRLDKLKQANALITNENWEAEWRKSSSEFYKKLRKMADDWRVLNENYAKVGAEITKIDEIANGIKRIDGIDRVEEFRGKVATNLIDKNNLVSGFSKVVYSLVEKSKEAQIIENQLNGKSVEDSKAQTLTALIALKALKAAQTDTHTELRAKLSLNTQNAASAQAAKDDLHEKTVTFSLWTQLANAIGTTAGDNFRDVAQAYTMRILLDQANGFLRKLSQRYELTCYSNSLAIMVIDKEMGGEIRSASSLSGGESFLVSLALALGLASLNDENINVDMLFIDEGFGTLDGESLEMAVQTLGNMRKLGKKVGIISHVSTLKERIPAQILVTKRGKAASTVEIVKA